MKCATCGAIALVHENLARSGKLKENKDFETLGTLVLALERIAAMDLRQTASHAVGVEVQPLLDEPRIVIESSLREGGVISRWEGEEDLPPVWADRQSLMQVFLNLTKNSERAMENREQKELSQQIPRVRHLILLMAERAPGRVKQYDAKNNTDGMGGNARSQISANHGSLSQGTKNTESIFFLQ